MTVVVIGSGSMIAGALRRHPATAGWRFLPHDAVDRIEDWAGDARCVVNLAFHPRLRAEAYDPELDIDLRLARALAPRGIAYVMASTRMVYGPPPTSGRLAEDMPAAPANPYGRSKLAAEQAVVAATGGQATVLRLSNIFDGSEGIGQRRSFLGMALRRLREEGRIVFDMSPFVERDFLPAELLAEVLVAIANRPVPGLFNIGAGFAVPTGRIAQWLIQGHGGGELLVTDLREFDAFWLDTTLARRTWTLPAITPRTIQDHCIAIARQVRPAA